MLKFWLSKHARRGCNENRKRLDITKSTTKVLADQINERI